MIDDKNIHDEKQLDDDEFYDDEEDDDAEDDESLQIRELITTTYDPPIKSLLQEIIDKELILNPPFQRKSVWQVKMKSRFIESILMNIPIPTIFFAADADGTNVVVDGQQRIRAIEEFYNGQYKLTGMSVLKELNGKRWVDLTPKQTRTIQKRILRCIVISEKSDSKIRFEVFERLNTGGMVLNDQELRNCVFRGPFNDFLNNIVNSDKWLSVIGSNKSDNRLRHQELLLRFLALENNFYQYKPPLKHLLNNFMEKHRRANEMELEVFRKRIEDALRRVNIVFSSDAFQRFRKNGKPHKQVNRALFDVQMIGFMGLDISLIEHNAENIRDAFISLCMDDVEFIDAISGSTADRKRYYSRFRIFGELLEKYNLTPFYHGRIPVFE